jgi:hypothetical protein
MGGELACQFEQVPVGPQKLGAWIDKSNWLAIENQRLSLQRRSIHAHLAAGHRLANVSARPCEATPSR